MPLLSLLVLAASPSPSPSPSVKEPDPDTVSPGWWGFLSLVFLVVTVYFIWRGLTKQLKRVDFDENAPQTIARGPRDTTPPASSPAPAADADPAAAAEDVESAAAPNDPAAKGDVATTD